MEVSLISSTVLEKILQKIFSVSHINHATFLSNLAYYTLLQSNKHARTNSHPKPRNQHFREKLTLLRLLPSFCHFLWLCFLSRKLKSVKIKVSETNNLNSDHNRFCSFEAALYSRLTNLHILQVYNKKLLVYYVNFDIWNKKHIW